jgi:hypothetical protein
MRNTMLGWIEAADARLWHRASQQDPPTYPNLTRLRAA